jgi:hypothetical protein
MNPAHVCLAYDSKKVLEFLNKQATVRLSADTARQAATALGTAVRNSMHFNSPPFDVNANSLNLVPQGSEGTGNYVLYYLDIPEAKITRFPLSTSSPEALKSWAENIRTLLANKSVTLQKIKGEPESLTQDELVSRVGDFGHMCELDPTMQQRFGVSNAKAFFAPEKARVKDKSPDYAGIKPGFINTSLMAAFKETNDDCVRYDVQYILPSESTVRQHLRLMLRAEPDKDLVRLVANVNRMYVVHPRIVISQEYIRYVAQSLPARDSAGRITEPNFESLRSYFSAVVCGSFNDGKYTAPKEAFSLQCSQLHEVARRRTQAGIPERAAATNQHNITVLPNAKAMFIPPQTASEGMLSAIDALLHKQAKTAAKLCVPPESSLDEVERYVDLLPDEPIPTGSGPTIPGRADAKVLFEGYEHPEAVDVVIVVGNPSLLYLGDCCNEKGFYYSMYTLNKIDELNEAKYIVENELLSTENLVIDTTELVDIAVDYFNERMNQYKTDINTAFEKEELPTNVDDNPFANRLYDVERGVNQSEPLKMAKRLGG